MGRRIQRQFSKKEKKWPTNVGKHAPCPWPAVKCKPNNEISSSPSYNSYENVLVVADEMEFLHIVVGKAKE